jgi:hypothetical protein
MGTDSSTLLDLRPDDQVHVSGLDDVGTIEGVVDVTAPHLDALWIRTSTGDRKLIDASQHKVQRID